MIEQHPITPPTELVEQWAEHILRPEEGNFALDLDWFANQAARWGANKELEACCEYMQHEDFHGFATELRAARRPHTPPTLKEQALTAMLHLQKAAETNMDTVEAVHIICRALEALPND